MKTPDPVAVFLSIEQLLAWKARMQERLLPDAAGDFAILQALVDAYLFVVEKLSAAHVSVARLKKYLFGSRSEKSRDILKNKDKKKTGDDGGGSGGDRGKAGGAAPKGGHGGSNRKNHGRNGVEEAHPGADKIPLHHPSFQPGCPCPAEHCKGKLYLLKKPGVVLRFYGQPALVARIYNPDRWRCHLCEKIFWAPLPDEVGDETCDATAVATIGILHFGHGLPFYRLEQLQASFGMRLPVANQYAAVSEGFRKLLPIFNELIRQAAQCEILHNDDTRMRILALLAQIKESRTSGSSESGEGKTERTGINTTAIVAISLVMGYRIVLYFTGTKHAGENLADVLEHRDKKLLPPMHESDGQDYNKPGQIPVVSGKCLTHGRRQFVDVITSYPEQCKRVVEVIGEVYRVDAIAKEQKLSKEERLFLHQEKSGPIMDALHRWMMDQLLEDKVEPNCGLGKAIKYMLKLWEPLTLFLRQPGAPLDNNITERALKRAIRHRKNSLFYKTKKGAAVGDLFMSFIETCALNGVDPFKYLTVLLRNADRAQECPGNWMPWNYRAMLSEETTADRCEATGAEPAASGVGPPGPRPPHCARNVGPATTNEAAAAA